MDKGRAWLEQQGWVEGQGVGKTPGIANPMTFQRKLDQETHDFNHYSTLYQRALSKIAGAAQPDPDKIYDGMFVKAGAKPYVKAPVAVDDELELLEKCGNRTARRSVKRLKADAVEPDADEKKRKKKRKKDKKKKKKK